MFHFDTAVAAQPSGSRLWFRMELSAHVDAKVRTHVNDRLAEMSTDLKLK